MKKAKSIKELMDGFEGEQPRLEWPDPIVKDSGFLWLEGTDIVGKSMPEIASKVLAVPNLRDLGVDEATVEEFATEGDNKIIFKWVKENIKPLYTLVD